MLATPVTVAILVLAVSRIAGADPAGDAAAVLQKHCAKCHANGKAEGDLGYVTDAKRLAESGHIVPGDAKRSELLRRVVDGEMPPAGIKQRPSAVEIEALRTWIDGLQPARPARARDWREIDRLLLADRARLPGDLRANARWFSFVHLANSGAGDAQLAKYRIALSTLLASLTWNAKAPSVVAIDPQRTVFRVDLRELGWSNAMWDTLRAAYPYGVARGHDVPEALRADWFVATASRPPLYHVLLAMPDTDRELGHRLGIDIHDNVSRGAVWRAGFNRSGVSVNNRVIERHATRWGAFWRSYDFASSTGRENVFAHPLTFVPAGGEIIFNLPNGFQAYMLVDAAGKRIDRAPTTIVSDPRRPDRAVENAVSCMGCHASGIIPKADQLRDATTFERDLDRDRVRQLHPTNDRLTAIYSQDRARFATALASIGTAPTEPADEPINALVTRYENELDLETAAHEVNLRGSDLAARLPRLTTLRSTLAGLAKRGGTIKRDTWITVYARLVDELGVGVPFRPHSGYDASPAVWVDDRARTWILVDDASDQATAIGICRGRGYVLPREADLVAAVANGLAAGLRIHRNLWTAGTKIDANNLRYAAVVDPRGYARRADATDKNSVVCVQR